MIFTELVHAVLQWWKKACSYGHKIGLNSRNCQVFIKISCQLINFLHAFSVSRIKFMFIIFASINFVIGREPISLFDDILWCHLIFCSFHNLLKYLYITFDLNCAYFLYFFQWLSLEPNILPFFTMHKFLYVICLNCSLPLKIVIHSSLTLSPLW